MSETLNISSDFLTGSKDELRFLITTEMIDKFAAFTGDFSSLHTNVAFASRSFYRERVAHGMLLISHLALSMHLNIKNHSIRITHLEGKFLKPSFAGDKLILTTEVLKIEDNSVNLAYNIKKETNNIITSRGKLSFKIEDVKVRSSHAGEKDSSLIKEKLNEEVKLYDQIAEGEKAEFVFGISSAMANNFYEILTPVNKSSLLLNELFTVIELSTLVGMKIPGRYATFLDFSVDFNSMIEEKKYKLKGEVSFKSEAAKAVVLQAGISDEETGTSVAEAKVTARVNDPAVQMPSMKELKESGYKLSLDNKVAVITGSSRGNGEVIAKLFALHGAKIAVNYFRSKDEAERVVKEITDAGGEAAAFKADVSSSDETAGMINEIIAKFGKIDILVNNAVRDFIPLSFNELSWDDIQKEIDVTVKGAFNCCKKVLPYMIKQNSGKIINMSSVATDNPPAKQFKYVVSKSALTGLTRSLAAEYAANNIQINMVVPSLVETDLTRFMPEAVIEDVKNNSPMKRNAEPLEVANAVLFLASAFSSYTTGQRLMVTGGALPFL